MDKVFQGRTTSSYKKTPQLDGSFSHEFAIPNPPEPTAPEAPTIEQPEPKANYGPKAPQSTPESQERLRLHSN